MRTSQAIRERIDELRAKRSALQSLMLRQSLENNHEDVRKTSDMIIKITGGIQALQWALEGAGE